MINNEIKIRFFAPGTKNFQPVSGKNYEIFSAFVFFGLEAGGCKEFPADVPAFSSWFKGCREFLVEFPAEFPVEFPALDSWFKDCREFLVEFPAEFPAEFPVEFPAFGSWSEGPEGCMEWIDIPAFSSWVDCENRIPMPFIIKSPKPRSWEKA